MKIIAIGMNYSLHCHELHAGEALPQEPVIFMKPDSALLKDSKPFLFPIFVNRWTTRRKWWCVSAVWEKYFRTFCSPLLRCRDGRYRLYSS